MWLDQLGRSGVRKDLHSHPKKNPKQPVAGVPATGVPVAGVPVAAVPIWHREAESLRWWKSIGTLKSQQDMARKLRMANHDHWYLDNQLPLPQTMLGSRGDPDVVLIRLRSLDDTMLDVSADNTIEFALEQGRKNTRSKDPKERVKGRLLRLRVIEIYYGFTDYLRGITHGCAQQHSLSTQNAYAVCRMLNVPVF
jgi:hypothetical protein